MIAGIANRKGCVIALCLLVALILGVAAALWAACRIAEQRYGFSPAPQISHEQYADNDTRVRLVVRPELLLPYLDHYLPVEGEAPMFGPSTSELLRRLLPREIALLARSDLPSDKIYLTLFANEKYGGPYIQTQINKANVLASVPGVQWTSNGLELRERGSLIAEGALALPNSLETLAYQESFKDERRKYWPHNSQAAPEVIMGGHLAELMVDNSNGDIVTLFYTAASFLGEEWTDVVCYLFPLVVAIGHVGPPPDCDDALRAALLFIIPRIKALYIKLHYRDSDAYILSLAIEVPIESGPGLAYLFDWITFKQLGNWLNDNFGLVLEGTIHGDENKTLIVGTYTLSGIEPILRDILSATATLLEGRGPLFDVLYSVNTALQK